MPRPRPVNLIREVSRHGKVRWYFRKKGKGQKRIRLPDTYGTKEFWEAYNAALEGRAVVNKIGPQTGSLEWLVRKYKTGSHFLGMAESSRRSRDSIYQRVCEQAGHVQYVRITKKKMLEAMNDRAAKPHAANNFLVAMNVLFTWAVKNDLLEKNPCEGVDPMNAKIKGHHTWSLEEVDQYRAKHPTGTKARLALDLLLFTGLRRSDLIVLGRQHVKNEVLTIKNLKTGAEVSIPIFPELRTSIDATPTGDMIFLTNKKGQPYDNGNTFFGWFARQVKAAGLPAHCSPHGLRKAGATIAANEGATTHQLMAMFGWTRLATAEVYTKAADRARLARVAAEQIANKIGRTQEKSAAQNSKNSTKTRP
ncbi:tyrosine-type recombinase/integrase [Mesorhizobium yinganensis]|uniref:tyrosine-type recombinase/integrase n=1 Tax=Mesorhizobium yinganensis TaxID=3157707 RepID=UPI0032B839A0